MPRSAKRRPARQTPGGNRAVKIPSKGKLSSSPGLRKTVRSVGRARKLKH